MDDLGVTENREKKTKKVVAATLDSKFDYEKNTTINL